MLTTPRLNSSLTDRALKTCEALHLLSAIDFILITARDKVKHTEGDEEPHVREDIANLRPHLSRQKRLNLFLASRRSKKIEQVLAE